MSKNTIIELQNVFFTYGCHNVLDNVNLEVRPGEVVGITGPNGAGKTTLLKLILGQLMPHKGVVKLFGENSVSVRKKHRIGYISQNARLFNKSFPATAKEVVVSGRVPVRGLLRRFRKEDYKIAEEALDVVGMLSQSDQLVGNMSGGQQQRVLLARAMVCEPLLLVMDEPTTGIDTVGRKELYKILGRLNREKEVTLVLVSHDVDEISPLITRQVCLDRKLCSCQKAGRDTRRLAGEVCTKKLALV